MSSGDEEGASGFNMDSLFTVDEDALQDAFKFDESKIAVDTSSISGGCRALASTIWPAYWPARAWNSALPM